MKLSRRRLLRTMGAAAAAAAAPRPLLAQRPTGTSVRRRPAPVRLSRNESAYGPSPAALAAIRDADTATLSLYPDVEADALREKLAGIHRVSSDRIALGAGATHVLRAAVAAFAGPTRAVLVAEPTCDVIAQAAEALGAPIVRVPLAHDWSHDLNAMRQQCNETTGLVYICNPHNPTGSLTRRSDIEAFVRAVPETTQVVVDEAYYDYVRAAPEYASFVDRPAADRAPIVLRSLSMAYGLAGLRVGYAVTAEPSIAALLEDGRAPTTITSASALAASAALEDRAHLKSVVAQVADDRQEFYNQANARMLRVIDSHANFVMLNTARRAIDIVEHFARNGVDLPVPFAPLDEYIRVTLGTASDMAEFWRVWDLMSLAHTL